MHAYMVLYRCIYFSHTESDLFFINRVNCCCVLFNLVHMICSLCHAHIMMQTVTAGMATSTREDIVRISRYVNLGGCHI